MAAAQAAILAPHQIVAVNQFLFTPIAQHGFDIGRRLSDQRLSFLTGVVHKAARAFPPCAVEAGLQITALKIPHDSDNADG